MTGVQTCALPILNNLTVLISKDLNFNMARLLNQLLEVNLRVREGCFRLRARLQKAIHEAYVIVGDSHATATASGHRLMMTG